MSKVCALVPLTCLFVASLAAANAPPGRYKITDYTVKDNVTGLVWQRNVDESTYQHAEAMAYCEDLALVGFADWRLPTVSELESIVDDTRHSPAMDPVAFPGAPPGIYFTSTLSRTNNAWVVTFGIGDSNVVNKTESFRARCVR